MRQDLAAAAVTDLLFEEAGVGRCLVAPDGSILRANAEWLRSTGFDLDDVLGVNFLDLFPETREMALALHARARAGHRVQVPRHAQHIQGRETWWEESIAPVSMEGGTALLITVREVTDDRREAERRPRPVAEDAAAARAERRPPRSPEPPVEPLARALAAVGHACGAFAAVVGGAHLVAWMVGAMATRGGAAITMKANAALCLLLLGSALLLARDGAGGVRRTAGRLCAALAIAVAGLTLVENLTGIDLAIDQLLARESPGALGVLSPNRMGTPASVCVVALGVGFLLSTRRSDRADRWAQGLALAVILASLMPIVGYLYGVRGLYGVARITAIAWPTALALLALAVGLFLARTTGGLRAQLVAAGPEGAVVRRLLLPIAILPIALGWLEVQGERAGLFDSAVATELSMLVFVICLAVLTFVAGRRAGRAASQLREQKQALAESEAKLRQSFAHASIGLAITSPDGRFLDANPAYCALTGYGLEELRSTAFHQLIDPEDAPANLVLIGRMLRGEIPDHVVEHRYRRRDGDTVWVRESVSLVRSAAGDPAWIIALVEDVTERRRADEALRESEQRFRLALRNAPVSVAAQDRELRYIWAYDQRMPPGGMVGRLDSDLLTPDEAAHVTAAKRRVLEEGIELHDQMWLDRPGGRAFVEMRWEPLRDRGGRVTGVASATIDLTAMKLAEETLRRHELVVRQSRDIILFMRRDDGRILEANPAATAAYGYTHDELVALTVHDLRAPGTRAVTAEQMREADREGLLFETVHQRKDGSTFPVEVSSRGATLGEGRTLVSIVRDISERRRAEAREREHGARAERRAAELDAVVDSVAEPLLVTDADGRLVRANPAFERLLGPFERWQGTETARRIGQIRLETPDGQPVDPALVPGARALRGEIVHGVLQRMRRDDGTVVHLSTSSAPIRTAEGVVGAVVIFADVSEQQRAAEALRETDRRKTEFLAVLSHELRNPLAPIRNSIAVMEGAPGSEVAGRALKILRRQADHLTRLVDDLLDLTRITHGKIELQFARLDLRDVVRETVADARAEFAQGAVELAVVEPDDALWVDADAARLAQMVTNLLGNALKFTPAGGRVVVRVSRSEGACEVAVRDTGVGIEPGDLERIFEPFVQVERTRRTHGGLGIGLALVREMASKHGGGVHARSEGAGAGAEFVLRLPPAAAPGLRSARELEGGSAPRSVLVVEDNADAASSLVEFLALRGHRATSVPAGRAGIAAVATLRPDVLICDIGLPDVSGHDVIRAVRAMPEGHRIFAIALSGYAQPRDREQALAAGFDAHVPKPPELEALLAMLGGGGERGGD